MNKELTFENVSYKFPCEIDFKRYDFHKRPDLEKVYEGLKIGLSIKEPLNNIFLIDDYSEEKLNNIINFINNIYSKNEKPKDICLITGEKGEVIEPIYLKNGNGNLFESLIQETQIIFIENIFKFYNSFICEEKENLIETIQKYKNSEINNLIALAKDRGFVIKSSNTGFNFIPDKEYEDLSKEEKDNIIISINKLKRSAEEALINIDSVQEEYINKIKIILKEFLEEKIQVIKLKCRQGLCDDYKALNFFNNMCDCIRDELVENYSSSFEEDGERINEIIYSYAVNVIVDNSLNENIPVIYEDNPTLSNLFGNVEYENKNGSYTTDIKLIKAGSLLKANGGCLILRSNSVLSNPMVYVNLMKSLMNGRLEYNRDRNYSDILSLPVLEINPIDINLKVILIGDYYTYDMLYNLDEDFKKIFKVRLESQWMVENNEDNTKYFLGNIYNKCICHNLLPLTSDAVKEVGRYFSRIAGDKNKLFINDNEMDRILLLSNSKAKFQGKNIIEEQHITEVTMEENLIQKETLEYYKEGKMILNVKSDSIGVVNGLCIIDNGFSMFGRPMRITCTCCKGEGNIINVEKESSMSGNIHNKSLFILKGLMHNFLGEYVKIPVDFILAFEQLYGNIDGDSASVGEVICMISAITKIPVRQDIAVTGSINQLGEIQPVGGINQKIEGFYNVCNLLDSIDGKGVLIPNLNKDDLALKKEVEISIKNKSFHIYTMENIQDAIAVMLREKCDVKIILQKELKKYMSNKKERL